MKVLVNALLVLVLIVSLFSSTVTAAFVPSPIVAVPQTFNPSYLSEMPAPARIIAEIKGKDAEDTIERQMGAFKALEKMVDDLAWGIEHRYLPPKATPDENKIKYAYEVAYAELWHKAARNEDHVYDHDRTLVREMMSKFFSQEFRNLLVRSDSNAAAYSKKHVEDMSAVPSGSPAAVGAGSPGSTTAMRRCIESGRSQRNCYNDTLNAGAAEMFGIDARTPIPTGLRMTGDFSGGKGVRLIFQPSKAVLTCNEVSAPMPYVVQINNDQAVIEMDNGPKAVVFGLKPDGKLSGAGVAKINGITANGTRTEQTMGSTTQTTTTTRELTPLEAQNDPNAVRNGQTFSTTESSTQTTFGPTGKRNVVNYENRVANCTLGVMTPTGPTPISEDIETPIGQLTTIFSGVATMMKGGSTKDAVKNMFNFDHPISPGLRMAGRYTGDGGFGMTFQLESVTLACGDAERALPYSVQRTANQTLIKIQDTAGPITFQFKPDGSLLGEGTVQVNGRTIVGQTEDPDNPFVYQPKVARCSVGKLVAGEVGPGGGQSPSGTSGGPAANSLAPNQNRTTPLQNTNNVPGTGSLSVVGNFPGPSSNLFAGKPVLFLRSNAEEILRREGFVSPPGSAVKSSLAAWATACDAKDMAPCNKGVQAIVRERVNAIGLTANGQAAFNNVPVGTYWVLVDFRYSRKHYFWNVRIDVKPGPNAVSLDQNNTFVVF